MGRAFANEVQRSNGVMERGEKEHAASKPGLYFPRLQPGVNSENHGLWSAGIHHKLKLVENRCRQVVVQLPGFSLGKR